MFRKKMRKDARYLLRPLPLRINYNHCCSCAGLVSDLRDREFERITRRADSCLSSIFSSLSLSVIVDKINLRHSTNEISTRVCKKMGLQIHLMEASAIHN